MKQRTLDLVEVVHINPRTNPMTHDELEQYIAGSRWQYAKTMPEHPHEYTIKKWAPTRQAEFEAAVMFIREHGYKKKWTNSATGRTYTYTYYNVGKHCYWTMGAPLDQTILINRALIAP